ncbi:hypothetical protein [Nocardia gamkensis]|uniref:Uncharacterized protein n=1 Tax=Nocardia gamkensis TaxID=352869 RepID=A0A7X6LBH3_9NOCA|nr:hypothetical protein [Nocardia gamkensis]NKY31159.1 hypothetical protein [Nocardia gamkensis]
MDDVAVVTLAASGLGAALCRLPVARGVAVVATEVAAHRWCPNSMSRLGGR